MLRLESHTSFLKYHGIEKYFGTSGPGDSSNKKLSQYSLKQIERLEEEEVKGLGGRDEWYKSLFGLEEYGVQSEPSKNGKQRLESHLTPIIVKYQPDDALKDIPEDAIISQPNVFMSYLLESSKSDTSQLASSQLMISKLAQSLVKSSNLGSSKYDKIKDRDKTAMPKTNAMSSIILDKNKQLEIQNSRIQNIDQKLQNEKMLKKFKKVEINKAELDIQSIEIVQQESIQQGIKKEEKQTSKGLDVSSIPGKDQILFFNSTFNFGQAKIEKDALTGLWPLGDDYVIAGYFNKGIYIHKMKLKDQGNNKSAYEVADPLDSTKVTDIGCSDIVVDKFRRLIFTNAKTYHLMITSPVQNLPQGLTSGDDFSQENGPYESKDLDEVLKSTERIQSIREQNQVKFQSLKLLEHSSLKKIAKFQSLSDSKGRNISISPDGDYLSLRSSNQSMSIFRITRNGLSILRVVDIDKFCGFISDFGWQVLNDSSHDYPRLQILTQSGSIKICCPEETIQDYDVNLNMVLNGKNNGKDFTCNLAPQYYAMSFNKFKQSIYVVNSTYDSKEGIYYSQLSI